MFTHQQLAYEIKTVRDFITLCLKRVPGLVISRGSANYHVVPFAKKSFIMCHCYALKSGVPPKCMCGSPNLQCDGIWSWDLGEANRVPLAPVGGALMMRSLANKKRKRDLSMCIQ